MRFATRTFLWSFLPFGLLLLASFAGIQLMVQSTVRERLRTSLRDTHTSIARVRARSELQSSRFLRILGENSTLKAGMELLARERADRTARLTLEDQLREIVLSLDFDFLIAADASGVPLAGVQRRGGQVQGMEIHMFEAQSRGIVTIGGKPFQVTTVPVDQGEENIGHLTLGEAFDFQEFSTPTVLTRNGEAVQSSVAGIPLFEVTAALGACKERLECEVNLHGETYLSLPLESIYFGDGYVLRSFQSVDTASAPVQSVLAKGFVFAGVGALLAALVIGLVSSRSIVQPIAQVVAQLRASEQTGLLPEFDANRSTVQEIQDLAASFNRAAAAILEARGNLHQAYVEFTGSLASALDARDPYTAGHSTRVSEYAVKLGQAMALTPSLVDQIRIGALLHDIGKIGVPDQVLQKPGRLTAEEFALIREHPGIGKRILEGVHGFEAYLKIVELHHENWDGSGYPLGLRGEEVPLDARIVHIADAYDAMTSDRPYRAGMSHEEALGILKKCAGTQFDPALTALFASLPRRPQGRDQETGSLSLQRLVEALDDRAVATPDPAEEPRS